MAAPDWWRPAWFQCKHWTSNLSIKHQSEGCGTDEHRIGRRELPFEFCQRDAIAARNEHAGHQSVDGEGVTAHEVTEHHDPVFA
jgi:hypothetical protein